MISVLYVDDDPDLLDIGKLFLEQSEGIRITTRPSAREALELLKEMSFDVILSDYQMPGMDGIEFLKKVRASKSEVPFILFTGKGREEVVIEAINNGADYYVQKGGDPTSQFAELAHKINMSAERRRVADALRNSEQRLADIINFLPDATFAIDIEGKVIAWNKAIEEVTGFSAAEMVGKGDHEYSIPFYGFKRPLLIDLILESDERINKLDYNIWSREADVLIVDANAAAPKGKKCIFYCKASPLYDKNGRTVGAIESIRDVTASRNAEEKLRTAYEHISISEEELRQQYYELDKNQKDLRTAYERIKVQDERLRQSFDELNRKDEELKEKVGLFRQFTERSPLPVAVYTDGGSLEVINDRFTALFGYDAKDVHDMDNWWIIAYPDPTYRAAVFERWNHSLATAVSEGKDAEPGEYDITCKDGSLKHVEVFSNKIGDKTLVVFNDISDRRATEQSIIKANHHSNMMLAQAIDERQRAEHALDESEGQYQRLIRHSFDPIIIHQGFMITQANDAAARLLRTKSPSDLIGRSILDYVVPEYHSIVKERVEYMYRTPDIVVPIIEETYVRADGSRVDAEVAATSFLLNGRPTVQAVLRDITEQNSLIRDDLDRTEGTYRSFVEGSSDGFAIIDQNGNVASWNCAFEEVTGIPSKDVLGKSFFKVHTFMPIPERLLPAKMEMMTAELKGALETGRSRMFERPVIIAVSHADGRTRDVRLTLFPFRTSRGFCIGAIARDITEKRQMEERLAQQFRFLQRLIDTLPNPFFFKDVEGRFQECNMAFADLVGLSKGEIIGRTESELFVEDLAAQFLKGDEELVSGPGFFSFETELLVRCTVKNVIFSKATLTGPDGRAEGILGVIVDITDRRLAEDTLRESEEQNRLILQNAHDGIMINELTEQGPGRFLDANDQACHILGYSKEELMGISLSDINSPEMRSKTPELIQELGKNGSAVIQFEYVGKNGVAKSVESSTALFELRGRETILSVIRDITQRKAQEERFSRVYKAFLRFGPDPLVNINDITALAGSMLHGTSAMFSRLEGENLRAIGLWNVPEGFISVGRAEGHICHTMIVNSADEPLVIRGLGSSDFARTDPNVGKYHLETYIGTCVKIGEKPLGAICVVYQGDYEATQADLEILGLLSNAIGIETERYDALLALRESESHNRAIIENMQEVYLRTDRDGRILLASPSAVKVFGYGSLEQIIGLEMGQTINLDPKDHDRFQKDLSVTGSLTNYIIRMKRRDNTPFTVTVTCQFYHDSSGQVQGVEGFLYDITEIKQAQEALAQANKKLNLLSEITRHDVLNKLTVLRSYLSLMENTEGKASKNFIVKAKNATEGIRQQIEFTRIYQDLGVKVPTWQNVSTQINSLEANKVDVRIGLDGLEIYADPLLEKVFYNLLDNSIRHGINVSRIDVTKEETENGLTIIWKDNGVGISAENKERIFQRGYGKNTGLGLFLVREILAITGIGIRETGQADDGARFEILVPTGAYHINQSKIPFPDA